jgi:hypothetical protein
MMVERMEVIKDFGENVDQAQLAHSWLLKFVPLNTWVSSIANERAHSDEVYRGMIHRMNEWIIEVNELVLSHQMYPQTNKIIVLETVLDYI